MFVVACSSTGYSRTSETVVTVGLESLKWTKHVEGHVYPLEGGGYGSKTGSDTYV
jgi:hypothetical protein